MTIAELVDFYLDKKLKHGYDFSAIKKELKEEHNLSEDEVAEVVDLISNQELAYNRNNASNPMINVIMYLLLGITGIIYSIYAIANPAQSDTSNLLSYVCLGAAGYIVFRNVKKLKSS